MFIRLVIVVLSVSFFSSLALAGEVDCQGVETHEIKMLNKSETDPKLKMVFEPSFVSAAPGDCLKFIPTKKGHNAETIKGMFPEGAKKFKSKINKEFVYIFEDES